MKPIRMYLFFAVCLLCLSMGFVVAPLAQPKPTWIMKSCYTLDEVTAVLNGLNYEQALTAKVTTINSQRSVFGALSTPYYVWYHNTPKQ